VVEGLSDSRRNARPQADKEWVCGSSVQFSDNARNCQRLSLSSGRSAIYTTMKATASEVVLKFDGLHATVVLRPPFLYA
jgi:hypothetical protein